MARKKRARGKTLHVDTLRHKDRRTNIPTEELRDFVRDEEHEPREVTFPGLLYARDPVCASKLKSRTLTNLYNLRPTWLSLAHRKLDETVFAAYDWPPNLPDDDLLSNLLALNLGKRL